VCSKTAALGVFWVWIGTRLLRELGRSECSRPYGWAQRCLVGRPGRQNRFLENRQGAPGFDRTIVAAGPVAKLSFAAAGSASEGGHFANRLQRAAEVSPPDDYRLGNSRRSRPQEQRSLALLKSSQQTTVSPKEGGSFRPWDFSATSRRRRNMVPISQGSREVTRHCLVNPVSLAISAVPTACCRNMSRTWLSCSPSSSPGSARSPVCRAPCPLTPEGLSALVTPKRPCERARAEPT
jgi:hypothetical protein